MTRALVVFEDRRWSGLRPLTEFAPVPALWLGDTTLAGRWMRVASAPLLAIEARGDALALWRDRPAPDPRASAASEVLAANAAALPGPWLDAALKGREPALLVAQGRIAAARIPAARVGGAAGLGGDLEARLEALDLPRVEVAAEFLDHPWQLVERNAERLVADLSASKAEHRGEVHRLACLENPGAIAIGEGARIEAFAVLDARAGPIRIERGARVAAHTVVTGPCLVGEGTELLGGSVARSTLGPQCRIAGEVEESVWQGWSNKRHHGFVGHSLVGEWVNLGALTTTSDLKNNYGAVRVWIEGAERDTGLQKVGAFLGAHVKTGIGTLLPTGASVGMGSNLFGGGRFAPRRMPPFSWWDGEREVEHRLEAFLETARHAMARRQRPMSAAEERALRACAAAGAAERAAGMARSAAAAS